MNRLLIGISFLVITSCSSESKIKPDYFLTADQKHNKWSSAIEPVLTVPSGSVIQAETSEASDGQLHKNATALATSFASPNLPAGTCDFIIEAISFSDLPWISAFLAIKDFNLFGEVSSLKKKSLLNHSKFPEFWEYASTWSFSSIKIIFPENILL